MSFRPESLVTFDDISASDVVIGADIGFAGSFSFREKGGNGVETSKRIRPAGAKVPKSRGKKEWINHKPKGAK